MLKNLEWKEKKWEGPRQFSNESLGEELMMLVSCLPCLY